MKQTKIGIIKYIVVLLLLASLYISGIYLFSSKEQNDNIVYNNDNVESLAFMYETEVGSGNYEEGSDSKFPLENYTFNEYLSRCENGSTITYDTESQSVLISADTSDKCYIYFDLIG